MTKALSIAQLKERLRASPRTKDEYCKNVTRFFTRLDGRAPTDDLAQEFIFAEEKRGLRPSSIAMMANSLRAYWKTSSNGKEILPLNAPKVQLGQPKSHPIEDIYKMMDQVQTPFERVLLTLLYDNGSRISEMMNITLDDIDWENNIIHVVRKGGRHSKAIMPPKSKEALLEWLKARKGKQKRVFMDFSVDYARRVLKRLAKRAGVENFTPHHLRHSTAVHLLDAGIDPRVVQGVLDHTSQATTLNLYGRPHTEDIVAKRPEW